MYKIDIVDGNLVIVVPVSAAILKDAPASKTGKSKVVASTHGFTNVSTPHTMLLPPPPLPRARATRTRHFYRVESTCPRSLVGV